MSARAPSARGPSRLWLELKALLLPIGAYWGTVLLSFGLFAALIAFTDGMDQENALALGGLAVATVGGVAIGQILALLRVRTWVVGGFALVAWGLMLWLFVELEAALGDVSLFAAMLWLFFPFFLLAGLWSLRVHMGLLATWAPLVYLTACILVISEETGRVAEWHAGNKWAIWDVFTAPVLFVGVMLLLVYLASREAHRLHRWRYGPAGPDVPLTRTEARDVRGASVLPGCGGVLAVVLLGAVLTVASALVAPYLWRTGPGEGEGRRTEGVERREPQPQQPQQQREEQGCNQEQQEQQQQQQQQTAQEQVEEALQNAAMSLFLLFLMLMLLLLALAIFGPPLYRTFLLQHLRRPLFPVPPTRQVQHAWRLVEVALADSGLRRRPGDSATRLSKVAAQRLPGLDPEPIRECAEIVDRVVYGLALRPDDTMRAQRTAEMAYQSLWARLSEWEKLRAVYRMP